MITTVFSTRSNSQALRRFINLCFVCFIVSQPLHAMSLAALETQNKVSYGDVDADILYLSDEIKKELDKRIRPIRDRTSRAQTLHSLMFANNGWNIDYLSGKTFTAQQTYEQKKGNCVSMAALYVAAARYVNLPARFQAVRVKNNWTPKEDYYLIAGHINAVIPMPRQTIHIEFIRTFFDIELKNIDQKRISDNRAFAEYHNNIAMELIENKDWTLAKQHLDKATQLAPKHDEIWSNYGVIHKFAGELDMAEEKYRRALKINKRNYSALTNLYVLMKEQGRTDEARKLVAIVERHSRNNPYHLAKMADTAYRSRDFESAIKLIKRAIRKNKDEPKFHHQQAKIFHATGKLDQALKALMKARKASEAREDENEIKLYQKKIDHILTLI